jgi:hypothetical protein
VEKEREEVADWRKEGSKKSSKISILPKGMETGSWKHQRWQIFCGLFFLGLSYLSE